MTLIIRIDLESEYLPKESIARAVAVDIALKSASELISDEIMSGKVELSDSGLIWDESGNWAIGEWEYL